ncbi:MAG TPA: hypothetical protein VGV38_12225 [Pyrinomonadaceae bacterium]|nr:hypothetical protein [Pyrinomonadaceae bacterium]
MTPRNDKNRVKEERLERLGRAVVRASAGDAGQAEAVASSPFLYARIKSRIAAERARREEGERWLALLGVVWRAVPAMGAAAVLAFALFLFTLFGAGSQGSVFADEVLLSAQDVGVEGAVFSDTQTWSSDDVLATLIDSEEGSEGQR